jgi:chromosome segregation ATPase
MNYSKVLTEEMKKIDPENKSLIEERQAVYEQLVRLNSGEKTAEKESKRQELGQKFNSIRQQLAQTEAQANETAEARAAMEGYNQIVTEKMAEINPDIQQKLERREQLGREFTDLRNAIIQQQSQ